MRLRSRSHSLWLPHVGRVDEGLQDLALPLGMSFAAVVAQVRTVFSGFVDRVLLVKFFTFLCVSLLFKQISMVLFQNSDGLFFFLK